MGTIDIWGDGKQTRSFLYIDECLEGIRRLMESPVAFEPLNIGSDEMISINGLVDMVSNIAGKVILINHIDGPQGVRGRCSDNNLIQEKLGWKPSRPLKEGLITTYNWINSQVNK
jgi:GDP-D-mannose 3', 5'-epimerase